MDHARPVPRSGSTALSTAGDILGEPCIEKVQNPTPKVNQQQIDSFPLRVARAERGEMPFYGSTRSAPTVAPQMGLCDISPDGGP
jgi:hypothetical protein